MYRARSVPGVPLTRRATERPTFPGTRPGPSCGAHLRVSFKFLTKYNLKWPMHIQVGAGPPAGCHSGQPSGPVHVHTRPKYFSTIEERREASDRDCARPSRRAQSARASEPEGMSPLSCLTPTGSDRRDAGSCVTVAEAVSTDNSEIIWPTSTDTVTSTCSGPPGAYPAGDSSGLRVGSCHREQGGQAGSASSSFITNLFIWRPASATGGPGLAPAEHHDVEC